MKLFARGLRLGCSALGALALGVVSLTGCTERTAERPERLDQVVVSDPNFDFSTTRSVRLTLQPSEAAGQRPVEVTDAEGRRLMNGAFRGAAAIDLKVPVGSPGRLTVRAGRGADAVQREIDLAEDGSASASF